MNPKLLKLKLCNKSTAPLGSSTSISNNACGFPILLSAHLSVLEACLLGHLYEALMCEAVLWGKAKQTGWPRHKESATQRHVAANPLSIHDTPLLPIHRTLLLEPHKPFHIPPSLEPREGKDGGGGGANSDFYSLNVTTSQRGPHDTATKSELMDSFLSPANMTGGVCVRERGCGRRAGAGVGACLPHWRGTWANEPCVI